MKLKFAKAYYYGVISLLALIATAYVVLAIGYIGNSIVGENPLDWRGYVFIACLLGAIAVVWGAIALFNWAEAYIDRNDWQRKWQKRQKQKNQL